MAEKPPYKLSIDLESYRPEAINAALERLRPEPGDGVDEVVLSGGGHEIRLKPRTA